MKRFIAFIILLIFMFSNVLQAHSFGRKNYIDIPSSNIAEGLFINMDGSYPLGSKNPTSGDLNGGLEFFINKLDIGLNWYSGVDFVLNASYQVMKHPIFPSVSIGIENITYRTKISPLGHDTTTFADEGYDPRPPEVASAYLVATKAFGEFFEATIGMGRGRFVGYGPRSHFLNFDAFLDSTHANLVFGLFGGMKLTVPHGPSFIIETDGRDANLGIQYEKGIFKGTLGVNKLEHVIFPSEGSFLTPRINVGFSIKAKSFKGPKRGLLSMDLMDEDTGEPIPGRLIYKDGEEKTVIIPSSGKMRVSIPSDIYLVSVYSQGHKAKQAKIRIAPGQTLNFSVKLSKTLTPNMKSSLKLVQTARNHYREGKLLEARKEFKSAFQLYSGNIEAKKGMALVDKAIEDTVATLKEKAIKLESRNINEAIRMWQRVLTWEDSKTIKGHIQELKNKLSLMQKRQIEKKPKPKVQKKKKEVKPTLTSQQISDLYKKGLKAYIEGNYSKAISYFQEILQANPDHAGAKRYLQKAKEKM